MTSRVAARFSFCQALMLGAKWVCWLMWRKALKIFRSGRFKDCSVCVLTLAIVAGAPIMASISVMLFF